MPTIEEIQARRAERKAQRAEARDEQYAKDLERLDELEVERGDDSVLGLPLEGFEPGLPTMVIVRVPRPPEMKRYEQKVVREKKADDASRELGQSTMLYPHPKDDKELFDRVVERWPGILIEAGNRASKLAQSKATERGKA